MLHTTTVRSWPAIGLGAFFTIGTAVILLWDVRSTGLTIDHLVTLGTLFGTIVAGHFIIPAFREKKILAGFGLAIAFLAGTFICVSGSAGRGGEALTTRAADAKKVNDERKDAADQLKQARADRADLAKGFVAECKTGKGPRCAGTKTTIDYADSHIAVLEARVSRLQPEQVANVKIKKAAEIWGRFSSRPRTELEADLELAWPFANALIWELLAIAFFNLAFGHEKREAGKPATGSAPKADDGRQRGVGTTLDDPVIAALKRAKRDGRRAVTNDELATLMGVTKDVASKRVRALKGHVHKVRDGRSVAISLPNDRLH